MYEVLKHSRDKQGYQTVYIDPTLISQLTVDDLNQWSVVTIKSGGKKRCEFTIPSDRTSSAYYVENGEKNYVLRRNLPTEIQNKVNETGGDVEVILYRWNPMKEETTGAIREMKGTKTSVWGKKSHRDDLASTLSKNFRKMI